MVMSPMAVGVVCVVSFGWGEEKTFWQTGGRLPNI
jgi:hypothetical protein